MKPPLINPWKLLGVLLVVASGFISVSVLIALMRLMVW